MKAKYIVVFLMCILALAISEYLFLSELNNQQRLFILLLASTVALAAIVTFFLFYRRLRKDV